MEGRLGWQTRLPEQLERTLLESITSGRERGEGRARSLGGMKRLTPNERLSPCGSTHPLFTQSPGSGTGSPASSRWGLCSTVWSFEISESPRMPSGAGNCWMQRSGPSRSPKRALAARRTAKSLEARIGSGKGKNMSNPSTPPCKINSSAENRKERTSTWTISVNIIRCP